MICKQCYHQNSNGAIQCEQCQANLYKSKIRITAANGGSTTHYLFSQNYSIGRSKDNDIIIRDDSVSRYHADLIYQDGIFSVSDIDSKNGSLLNNLTFKNCVLQNNDNIQLGKVVLHYFTDEHQLLNPTRYDTIAFVQKEYFKLAEKQQNRITTTDALQTVLDLVASLISAEAGVIFEFTKDSGLKYKLGTGFENGQLEIDELIEDNKALFDEAFHQRETQIELNRVISTAEDTGTGPFAWHCIAIPLLSTIKNPINGEEGEVIGLCYLSHNKQQDLLSRRKKELLTALAQQMSLAVENDMIQQMSNGNGQQRDENAIIMDIQKRLLPVAKLNQTNFSVVSFAEPCETISGDYFDVIAISDKTIGFAMGDICGKGVPAALLSSTAQAAIRSQIEYSTSPARIIQNLNRLLMRSSSSAIFLTLFFGILDQESNQFTYVNAGHPPPIFIKKNRKIRELAGTSPPLGIIEGEFSSQRTIKFNPGEILIMYTDGLIESHDSSKQIYGRKRLLKLVTSIFRHPQSNRYNLDFVVNTIKSDLIGFTNGTKQADDLTLLAAKRKLKPKKKQKVKN